MVLIPAVIHMIPEKNYVGITKINDVQNKLEIRSALFDLRPDERKGQNQNPTKCKDNDQT